MKSMLDFALFYASKGWHVFPCRPRDKTPLVKWADEATTDKEKITSWWTSTPTANIGIATGARSGLLVIDIDPAHGGESGFQTLGELPPTVTAITGGGGRHLLFAHPGVDVRNSASKIAPGVDVRGDGGYIVAAPSVHPNGNLYTWMRDFAPSKTPLSSLPAEIISKMTERQELNVAQATAQPAQDVAYVSGGRNTALASLAGTMRRRGMSEQTIYVALLEENRARCFPPLDIDEVAGIAKSVCRYEPTAPPNSKRADRIYTEWLFVKSLYENPISIKEFEWLPVEIITDETARKLWENLKGGMNTTEAAIEAGAMAGLQKVGQVDSSRLDAYASELAKFGYLANINRMALQVAGAAERGELEKVHSILSTLADEKPITTITPQTAEEGLNEFLANLDNPRVYIRTGIRNFDNMTGGLERQAMSVLAARPSVGKTTLAWQIARNVAASGQRVLFISIEVAAAKLWRKAALGIAEVSHKDIIDGSVPKSKLDEIRETIIPDLIQVYNERLYIYDDGMVTTDIIWRLVMHNQPDLVVIDHLGLIKDKGADEVKRLGEITSKIKALAKKADCHVLLIHQLNRAVESRENKEPQLSDLRDSGHVEQDADMVIMPYRSDYYEIQQHKPRYSETKLLLRKNRDDRAGFSVVIYMDLLQQWFYRLDELPPGAQSIKL